LVEMSEEEMSVEEKAKFLIALRNYKCGRGEKWSDGIDFVSFDVIADEKVFVRSIESRRRAGFVGADNVKSMLKVMMRKGCKRGVLVGKRFTAAASQEMGMFNIEQVSDDYMPPFRAEDIMLTINNCADKLCRMNCGAVPLKKSDCKGSVEANLCRVRLISDDALFHCEHGWMNLLKNDLRQLLFLNENETV
jgi:hypothetical protein